MGKIVHVEFHKKEPTQVVPKEPEVDIITDDDGFVDIPVIIQDSGGDKPAELNVIGVGIYGGEDQNKQCVAGLNEKDDQFSYYLATAKIKILPGMKKWTNDLINIDMANTVMLSSTTPDEVC